jgi:hypothetical protein
MLFAMPSLAEDFGRARVVALSSDANASFQYVSLSPSSASGTSFLIRPAVDVFLADKLSLGGFAVLSSASVAAGTPMGSSATITTVGLGPRLGYNVELADRFSIWPKLGFSWASVSGNNASDSQFALVASGHLLYHPVPHFFVGFGPDLAVDLSGKMRSTTLGAAFAIGGWI